MVSWTCLEQACREKASFYNFFKRPTRLNLNVTIHQLAHDHELHVTFQWKSGYRFFASNKRKISSSQIRILLEVENTLRPQIHWRKINQCRLNSMMHWKCYHAEGMYWKSRSDSLQFKFYLYSKKSFNFCSR